MNTIDWTQFTFLIAEDEEDLRDALCMLIERHGGKVYAARNGSEAFEIFQKQKIDVVISDSHMPGTTGLELLKKMCEDTSSSEAIFFLATGFSDMNVNDLKTKGAVGVLAKPFSGAVFDDAIQQALNKPRSETSHRALRQPSL